ncbi:MAG: Nif3-like dinuclear metal center hexameric protein [Deltaproteobacteria bacterium]|nr:Nif3-like dinuclear metal center hexameric protein [Deltaproteobacteria bacterium]
MSSLPLAPAAVVAALDARAPLRLAAPWDNVGLLVAGDRPVRRLGLCVDLRPAVLDAFIASDVDLIVAYHPPIFAAIKRVVGQGTPERTLARALRAGLSIYSPHTALDAVPGGMGDWLVEAAGPVEANAPIQPDLADPRAGLGRRAQLCAPAPLHALLPQIAAHLGLRHLRVAGDRSALRSALWCCPGAGGELMKGAGQGDLVLTGELGHHEVLRLTDRGAAVVLTEHSNCERGFLPRYADQLRAALPGVDVQISPLDVDPLEVWSAG